MAARNTIQRQLVLDMVQATKSHPTAEEIYQLLEQDHPSIGRATVYRNLSLLVEKGEILRVSHLNAADRFDFNTTPHHHFRCLTCGKVHDVDHVYDSELLAKIPTGPGFLYTGYELVFVGICPECNQQHATTE